MGRLVSDQTFLNENIFKFEKRMESQYTKFLDKTPTFVTYYSIDNINSITDSGFLNIEKTLGENSPLRYKEIKDFPIYGIEAMKMDLNEDEEGLDISHQGDAIILPNTVDPLPNDFFTITYMNKDYLFEIINVDYDTIKSNNYYKIEYNLRSLTPDNVDKLKTQVREEYTCIYKNIGTEDNCLVKSDDIEQLNAITKVYNSLADKYKTLYFNKRYNSFIYKDSALDLIIYDKYLNHFIQDTKLFENIDSYDTLKLSNEDPSDTFIIEYANSIYKIIEDCNLRDLDYTRFTYTNITSSESVFNFYGVKGVKGILFDINDLSANQYIRDTLIENIKNVYVPEDYNPLFILLIKYFNNQITTFREINIESIENYRIVHSREEMLMIPIAMYVLRKYCKSFMQI